MTGYFYLASPYSDPDPKVREARFLEVCKMAAWLMENGTHVYCPIAHSHPIAEAGLDWDGDTWVSYDKTFMKSAAGLIVFMLDGWKESCGVQEEIRIFQEANKPILYLEVKDAVYQI